MGPERVYTLPGTKLVFFWLSHPWGEPMHDISEHVTYFVPGTWFIRIIVLLRIT